MSGSGGLLLLLWLLLSRWLLLWLLLSLLHARHLLSAAAAGPHGREAWLDVFFHVAAVAARMRGWRDLRERHAALHTLLARRRSMHGRRMEVRLGRS